MKDMLLENPGLSDSAILDSLRCMVGLCDLSGNLLTANRSALDFARLQASDLKGKKLWESPWWNSEEKNARETLERVAQGQDLEVHFSRGDQNLRLSLRPIRGSHGQVQAIQFEGDIVVQDPRFREMNHRFKNHLQVITSVLYFQGRQVSDPGQALTIEHCRSLIQSIALAYNRVPNTGGEARIRLGEYLQELIKKMSDAKPGTRDIHCKSDPISITLDLAVPLALLLHELLAQALELPSGRLWLTAQVDSHVNLAISIRQDGETEAEFSSSRLIEMLTRQLRARVQFPQERGDSLTIYLPKP